MQPIHGDANWQYGLTPINPARPRGKSSTRDKFLIPFTLQHADSVLVSLGSLKTSRRPLRNSVGVKENSPGYSESASGTRGYRYKKISLTFRLRRASVASISVYFTTGHRSGFFMDVQTDLMHDSLHGSLAPFIEGKSGASHASLILDRSPLGDNPRNYAGITPPLNFLVKR